MKGHSCCSKSPLCQTLKSLSSTLLLFPKVYNPFLVGLPLALQFALCQACLISRFWPVSPASQMLLSLWTRLLRGFQIRLFANFSSTFRAACCCSVKFRVLFQSLFFLKSHSVLLKSHSVFRLPQTFPDPFRLVWSSFSSLPRRLAAVFCTFLIPFDWFAPVSQNLYSLSSGLRSSHPRVSFDWFAPLCHDL